MSRLLRLGFLASHEGTTMQAILDACLGGRLEVDPVLLVHNNAEAPCAERARRAGVPTRHLSGCTHPDPDALDAAILEALVEHEVGVVVLAGYMKKIGPRTLARFRGRILNTHPALLPEFGGQGMYGRLVHEAVLAAEECESGATIHLVDDEYDHGPIVAQCRVPVLPDDSPESLAERVQKAERRLWVDTLQAIASGSIRLDAPAEGGPGSTP